jgi:tetratricopeptide (TPR) repeat protein
VIANDRKMPNYSFLGISIIATGTLATVLILATSGRLNGADGGAIVPFGSLEFVVVHVLAALPLSLWLADRMIARLPRYSFAIVGCGVIFGLIAVYFIVAGNFEIASWCSGLSNIECGLIRVGLGAALLLSWCVIGRRVTGEKIERSQWTATGGWLPNILLVLALAAIALGAPEVYITERTAELSRNVESLAQGGRYWEAWQTANLLREMGSQQFVLNQSPGAAADGLAEQIKHILDEASKPLNADAALSVRLQRARNLASLDQLDAAEQILGGMPQHDPAACLLLAAIQQQRRQWDNSNRSCHFALQLLAAVNQNEQVQDKDVLRMQAYDGLITNYYQQRDFATAEIVLVEALSAVPAAKAYFHFRLGEHYQLAGRYADAAKHYQISRELSPTYQAQIAVGMQAMNQGISGCLFSPAVARMPQMFPSH